MSEVATHIALATSLVAKKPDRAILALLDAWRVTRSPVLATTIDRISRANPRRPLGGSSLADKTARWNEVAEKLDPLDAPRLAATLATGRAQSAGVRIEKLLAFPDDPRIAQTLVEFITVPPYSDGTAMALATKRAVALLVRIADARTLVPLGSHACIGSLRDAVAAKLVPLDPEAASVFARLDAQFAETKSGEDLLAAIYASPDDDAPRSVYADWLLEQGDTRGELIHLQLAGEDTQHVRELVKKHERAMIGPLGKVTSNRSFQRGFLTGCTLDPKNTRSMITASTAREWLTVEAVGLGIGAFIPNDLFAKPSFRNIRRITNPSVAMLELLPPATKVTAIDVNLYNPELRRRAIELAAGIPELRALGLPPVEIHEIAALAAGPLGGKLVRLTCGIPNNDALVAALTAVLPTTILEFVVAFGTTVTATRTAANAPWNVAIPGVTDPAQLARILRAPLHVVVRTGS